jgi:hypothetical protein
VTWRVFVSRAPHRRTDLRVFTDLAEARRYYNRLAGQGAGLVWLESADTVTAAARTIREQIGVSA